MKYTVILTPQVEAELTELWLAANENPRCGHCLVYFSYEASAALSVNSRLGDSLKKLLGQLT